MNAIESIRGARGHSIARASVVHRARGRADVDARTDDDGGDARVRDGDLVVVIGGGGASTASSLLMRYRNHEAVRSLLAGDVDEDADDDFESLDRRAREEESALADVE